MINQLPVSTPATQTVCSDVAITAIALTNGTTFTWTRIPVAGNPSGMPSSGSGTPITGTLTNTGALALNTTFTITNNNGCQTTAVVTVRPRLNAPTVTVTQPTCPTPTGTITVNTPAPAANIVYSIDGVTYTNTTGIFSGLAGGTSYNVTYKNTTTGCISQALANVAINNVPTPPGSTNSECNGTSLTVYNTNKENHRSDCTNNGS